MEWEHWRQEFPSCACLVHMNHAGIAPLPRRVVEAIRKFADEGSLIDTTIYARWTTRTETVRAALARLIGAQAHEVAFIRNTSEGLSIIAGGLSWHPGDNVVALADEYPANIYPWWGLRRFGVETRLVQRPQLRFGVDEVAPLVDRRTKVLAISAVDWQTGFRADLAALGGFCRERGILFCIDAIQALGVLRVDVDAVNADCLAAGGHKWMLGPEGCGGLYVSDRIVEHLDPTLLGWKSVEDADRYLPYHFTLRRDALRFEPGSPSHLGIHALGAALDLLTEVGPENIETRVLNLTEQLAEGLRRCGATILSPWGAGERSGIVTFQLGEARALLEALSDAGIVAQQRMDGVRLAPHFYNNEEDVTRVLEAVHRYQRA